MTGGFDNAPPSPKLVRKIRTNCYLVNAYTNISNNFMGAEHGPQWRSQEKVNVHELIRREIVF